MTAEDMNANVNLSWAGGGDTEILAELLAASRAMTVCTSFRLTSGERSLFASATVTVVISLGGREILEGEPDPNVRQLVHSGAAIALSTGYHPKHAPTFSMQMAIALAVLRLGLTPEEAIAAATINAAHAIGCGHLIGSLEVGKRADLIVLNVPDYREIPLRFGINHVAIAIRDGNIVFNRMRTAAK
jgi:imidazolonepropionase